MSSKRFSEILSEEEVIELANRIQLNDLEALNKLICSSLRLVPYFLSEYIKKYPSFSEDILQEGFLGLIRAAQKFEPGSGSFVTYAFWWIRSKATRFATTKTLAVDLPAHVPILFNKLKGLRDLNISPNPEEIAEALGVTIKAAYDLPHRLHRVIRADLEQHPSELNDPEEELQISNRIENLHLALAQLPSSQAQIVRQLYGIGTSPHTLEEVGKMFKVSRERIRQIKEKAFRKLRFVITEQEKIHDNYGRIIELERVARIATRAVKSEKSDKVRKLSFEEKAKLLRISVPALLKLQNPHAPFVLQSSTESHQSLNAA